VAIASATEALMASGDGIAEQLSVRLTHSDSSAALVDWVHARAAAKAGSNSHAVNIFGGAFGEASVRAVFT
jgi:hypothetical protein